MTARKADIPVTSRLTAYGTHEGGAAELQVSPSTWDGLSLAVEIAKRMAA